MKVPLSWLAEYVKLPPTKQLTDRLTMIGHMLDKETEVAGEKVIDLELRGNRADLFGILGVARDVSAAFETPLKMPPALTLPRDDPKSPLVRVEKEAADLVKRFTALKLKVKIKPSPEWMRKRLEAYGMPAINNVIDITNYVMLETVEPMHAFDLKLLKGGCLILRRAKKGEVFHTIQQGTTVNLTSDDLAICDKSGAQTLTMIGGLHSGVNEKTQEIMLEAAVYNQGNCRRSARRLKIFTEGGTRHEKNLDPYGVQFALERAVYLLKELAEAEVTSLTSNYFPDPPAQKILDFDMADVKRLGGVSIPEKEAIKILNNLEFLTRKIPGGKTSVTVPTFRTDVEEPADLVEEVVRIFGYEHVPLTPLADEMPEPSTYPSYAIGERLRDLLTRLGLNEVVTLSMVSKELAPDGIDLVNPPDPNFGKLRTEISPSLIGYAKRLVNLNQQRVTIFEIGKVFGKKCKTGSNYSDYFEKSHLGIALTGKTEEKNWNNNPKDLNIYDLKGVLERTRILLGVSKLEYKIGSDGTIFWAEIELGKLLEVTPPFSPLYAVTSGFPPVVEDVNVVLPKGIPYDQLVNKIEKSSPLVKSVRLIDKFGSKLTLRITYHSDERQLASEDVEPVRKKIMSFDFTKGE